MTQAIYLADSRRTSMPPHPPHSDDARLAVLEEGARRTELAERDLWAKLREQRDDTADDLKELRVLFDQNMKASAEIITAAREVVKRVDDVARRQDALETNASTYRETADKRMGAIELAHRDIVVRRRTLVGAWSMVAGLISAGAVAAFHKLWP
jgi:hypothetical protein